MLAPCVRKLVYGKCARMQPRILTNFCTTVFLDDATADRRTRLVGKRHPQPPPFATMECAQAQVRSKGHGQTQRSKPGSGKNRVCRPRLHSARMAGAGCRPASHHGPSRPSRVPHHRAGLRSRRLAELGRGLSPRLRARGRTGTGAQGARGGRDKLLPSRRARASGPCDR